MMRRTARRSAGFSTADLLAGMGLSMIALGAIYSYGKAQMKALTAQSAYNDSQNVTRSVIDLMSRELRMATYDPNGPATDAGALLKGTCGYDAGIIEATPSKIRFKQDLNGDSTINSSGGEDVTYDVLGSTIRRQDGAALPENLVTGVTVDGFVLKYYNNSNPPAELVPSGSPPALTQSQRDCVAKVRILVKARVTDSSSPDNYALTSQASTELAIRNRSLINF